MDGRISGKTTDALLGAIYKSIKIGQPIYYVCTTESTRARTYDLALKLLESMNLKPIVMDKIRITYNGGSMKFITGTYITQKASIITRGFPSNVEFDPDVTDDVKADQKILDAVYYVRRKVLDSIDDL